MVSFEMPGIVSVWVGQIRPEPGSNALREKFGVEYYDSDFRDCIVGEGRSPIRDLAYQLSYSESFLDSLLQKAADKGVTSAWWILAQYDFAYDPARAGLSALPAEPSFLGNFHWHD